MLTPARAHICSSALAETAAVVVPRRAPRRPPRRILRTSTARRQARLTLSLISSSPPRTLDSTDSHPDSRSAPACPMPLVRAANPPTPLCPANASRLSLSCLSALCLSASSPAILSACITLGTWPFNIRHRWRDLLHLTLCTSRVYSSSAQMQLPSRSVTCAETGTTRHLILPPVRP